MCSSDVFGGVINYNYLWSNNMNVNEIYNLNMGEHYVWVTDANDCKIDKAFLIQNLPKPVAEFIFVPSERIRYFWQIDNPIQFTDKSIDSWSSIEKWSWNFGDGSFDNQQNTNHSFYEWGDYTVELIVENKYSCLDTITKKIYIEDYVLYIPNSFTPNYDNNNDVFQVKGMGISSFNIEIFNRWGEVCFRSDDINKSWDGYVGNSLSNSSLYMYVIKVMDNFGESHTYEGKIKLIK